MDVLFNCPNCQQELSVDAAAAGAEIECPTCRHAILVPEPTAETSRSAPAPVAQASAAAPPTPANPPAPAAATALGAERHFSVPFRDAPTESLIEKPLPTLEVAAKDTTKRMRVKSIKRSDCVEVGKDHFDETVTSFLAKIGEENVISLSTFNYTHMDLATRDWVTDYGILIVFRG